MENNLTVDLKISHHPNGEISTILVKSVDTNKKLRHDERQILNMLDAVLRTVQYRTVYSEATNQDFKLRKYFGSYVLEYDSIEKVPVINGNVNSEWVMDKIENFSVYANEEFEDGNI